MSKKAKKKSAKKVKKQISKREKCKLKSNYLGNILKINGMTQSELASMCDTNKSHINRIVNGGSNCVSLPMALKIAKALDIKVEDIFELEEAKEK